jgi:8-hydroxy-5-deazaflavin:NADPH oxidoreductase
MATETWARQADPMLTGEFAGETPLRRVGIIGGTGPAGSGLAMRLCAAGHTVLLGSRDLGKAKQRVDELHERWGDRLAALVGVTNSDAALGDIVVLATVAESAVATATEHAGELAGRIVVSMANLLTRTDRGFAAEVPPEGSVALAVQRAVPSARVVGAFQNLPAKALGAIDLDLRADVVVCGDDPDAVASVVELIASIEGLHPLDGGPLANAVAVEAFTAVLLTVNRARRAEHGIRIVPLRSFDA